MNYAKKIDLIIDTSPLKVNLIKPHYTYDRLQKYAKNDSRKPVILNTFFIENQNDFVKQLPQKFLIKEIPVVSILEVCGDDCENSALSPHIDIGRYSTLNYYIKTNDEVTHFYNWEKISYTLNELENFTSKQGECWLIDVSVPHAVSLKRNEKRQILSFSFVKTKFSELI